MSRKNRRRLIQQENELTKAARRNGIKLMHQDSTPRTNTGNALQDMADFRKERQRRVADDLMSNALEESNAVISYPSPRSNHNSSYYDSIYADYNESTCTITPEEEKMYRAFYMSDPTVNYNDMRRLFKNFS